MDYIKDREKAVMETEPWKRMYMILLHTIDDVLEKCPKLSKEEIIALLTEASLRAEDYYINVSDAGMGLPEERGSFAEDYKNLGSKMPKNRIDSTPKIF